MKFVVYLIPFVSTLSSLVMWVIRIAIARYGVNPAAVDQKLDTYHPFIKNTLFGFSFTSIKYRFADVSKYPAWWYIVAIVFWLPFDVVFGQILCDESGESMVCLLTIAASLLLIALAGKILIDTLVVSGNTHD